jgi:cytosine/adenosine deaminase-related metal-dependent hydrolase
MAYRKLSAPRILTGKRFLEGNVLITTETGRVIDLVNKDEAGEDLEDFEGILCPGFVNAHCHTELSHMKGAIPRNTGMVSFLMQVMFDRQAGENGKQAAMIQAIEQMFAGGIVAVGDICNTSDSVAAKAATQQVFFHNFIEASGFVPSTALTRFDQAVKTREKFLHYFPASQSSITPHAAYSVSQKLMQLITDHAPALLSIHNQESQAEEDFIRNKMGEMLRLYDAIGIDLGFFEPAAMSSLQYMLSLVPESTSILLVHNCYTIEGDIEWLNRNGFAERVHFCICPNANQYIGNPLPSITILQESGYPICVGTDSLASNDQLSILAELQTLQLHFPFLSTAELLQWATYNGALALGIAGEFGSFTKGSKPGVLQIILPENDSLRDAPVTRIL